MAHSLTKLLRNGLAVSILLGSAAPVLSQPQEGLAFVQQNCAMCHAIGATGNSPHPAAPPFRRLGNSYDLGKLQVILQRGTILPAHPDMPLFKLDESTARAVISYLRSVQE